MWLCPGDRYLPHPSQTWNLGYNGIRSTSGRYAFYWNVFLFRNYVESFCNLVNVYWMFAPPSSACVQLEVSCNKRLMKKRRWSTLPSYSSHCTCLKLSRPVFSKAVLYQFCACNGNGLLSLMSFIMQFRAVLRNSRHFSSNYEWQKGHNLVLWMTLWTTLLTTKRSQCCERQLCSLAKRLTCFKNLLDGLYWQLVGAHDLYWWTRWRSYNNMTNLKVILACKIVSNIGILVNI